MEKRFKVADLAQVVGCTPKTIYKMIERDELITVSERVNNRETTFIVITEEQIDDLKSQFGKLPVNEGNCNDFVTVNYGNEPVKNNNNNDSDAEIIEKVITLSREYTERLTSVNEELITAKSKMLFLTDKLKCDEDSKDYWQKEYFKKDYEVKETEKKKLMVIYRLITVIVFMTFGLITLSFLYFIEKQKPSDNNILTGKNMVSEQQLPVNEQILKTQPSKKVPQKKK